MFPETHPSIPRYHVSMRLLVLSARPGLRTNLRLSEAGSELGVEVSVADATTLSAVLENTRLSPVGDGVLEPAPEAVLARVGNWRPESLLAILEALLDHVIYKGHLEVLKIRIKSLFLWWRMYCPLR